MNKPKGRAMPDPAPLGATRKPGAARHSLENPAPRPAARPRAIALGAICATRIYQVDQIPPPPAKVLAQRMVAVIDGMALSAACAFAKLGGEAAIWARLGDDAQGADIRTQLAAQGLDIRALHVVPGSASSQAAVIVDGRGERLVIPFHDPQVDRSADWLPLERVTEADIVLVDVRWPEGAEALMHAARAAGVPTMLDGDTAPAGVLDRLVPLASHAVFSDAGLLAWTGLARLEDALLQVAASQRDQVQHVGASCGADGYAWVEAGQVRRVPAPRVAVVDTLAAGDVFHGAFALACMEGQGIEAAARFACHAASLKCTRFGGRLGCPTRDEVQASIDTCRGPAHAGKPD
jgi:sulfofructose kinase